MPNRTQNYNTTQTTQVTNNSYGTEENTNNLNIEEQLINNPEIQVNPNIQAEEVIADAMQELDNLNAQTETANANAITNTNAMAMGILENINVPTEKQVGSNIYNYINRPSISIDNSTIMQGIFREHSISKIEQKINNIDLKILINTITKVAKDIADAMQEVDNLNAQIETANANAITNTNAMAMGILENINVPTEKDFDILIQKFKDSYINIIKKDIEIIRQVRSNIYNHINRPSISIDHSTTMQGIFREHSISKIEQKINNIDLKILINTIIKATKDIDILIQKLKGLYAYTTQEEQNAQIESVLADAMQELEEVNNQSNDISNNSSHVSSDNAETAEVDIDAISDILRYLIARNVRSITTALNDPNAEHVNTQNQNINR